MENRDGHPSGGGLVLEEFPMLLQAARTLLGQITEAGCSRK